MAKDRDQGPHYIPELDPQNPKRRGNPRHWLWLSLALGGFVSLGAAVFASRAGADQAAFYLAVIGVCLVVPFLFAVSIGG